MPQILAAYIKSNRSKCKKCQKFIIPDGVKLGVNISDRSKSSLFINKMDIKESIGFTSSALEKYKCGASENWMSRI